MKMPKPRILLMISGSIAAYKSALLVSRLMKNGYDMRVILSESSLNFVGAATFEGLGCNKVLSNLFATGDNMAHIQWERWADLVVVYPATAQTIGKMANGIGDDLLGAVFLAHEFKKPFMVFPAMNQGMWSNPAVKQNIERVRRWGIEICGPVSGPLACGETGPGRVVEPEEAERAIVRRLQELETEKALLERQKLSILVTAGATIEYIDPVRIISNVSSGATGVRIAEGLNRNGHNVTLYLSKTSSFEGANVDEVKRFDTTDDLSDLIEKDLRQKKYDLIIHCAAVSDFKPRIRSQEKISSEVLGTTTGSDPFLTIELIPNKKILRNLYNWRDQHGWPRIVSFKLTANSPMGLESYESDWIVHNEWRDVSISHHSGTMYKRTHEGNTTKNGYKAQGIFSTKDELTAMLLGVAREIRKEEV